MDSVCLQKQNYRFFSSDELSASSEYPTEEKSIYVVYGFTCIADGLKEGKFVSAKGDVLQHPHSISDAFLLF